PPTPALYTLSLHDALPICLAPAPALLQRQKSAGMADAARVEWGHGSRSCRGRAAYRDECDSAIGQNDAQRRFGGEAETLIGARPDRKSTRLNSSHVSISYA